MVTPYQAAFDDIIRVDLVGTAIALDIFGEIVAPSAAGLVVSSMAGHMFAEQLSLEEHQALAVTPAEP